MNTIGASFASRRRSVLVAALAAMLPGWSRAQGESLAIVGKDHYLFAGWGQMDRPDWTAIDASVALIADVHRRLAARGIALIVPVLPSKKRFYEDKLPPTAAMNEDMRIRYQSMEERLQQAGVRTVALKDRWAALLRAGTDVYYRTDQHWTLPAADAAAEATAEAIRQAVPALRGAPGSGLALGTIAKERRYGDLAERFLSPEQRLAAGRETFTVRRLVADAGLLADSDAPVHVTGNSMVQPYFGFPQKLSNVLDRPVSVNWKPGDVGFWLVLLEYLESPAFRSRPPQAVVWQLFEPNLHLGPDAKGLWDSASLVSLDEWSRRLGAALAA